MTTLDQVWDRKLAVMGDVLSAAGLPRGTAHLVLRELSLRGYLCMTIGDVMTMVKRGL